MEIDEENELIVDPETKLKIAKALIEYNPKLESFQFDYDEIAKLQGTNIEEAKEAFDHIELNTREGELATQITIFDNTVSITVPYWYQTTKPKRCSIILLNTQKLSDRRLDILFTTHKQTKCMTQ